MYCYSLKKNCMIFSLLYVNDLIGINLKSFISKDTVWQREYNIQLLSDFFIWPIFWWTHFYWLILAWCEESNQSVDHSMDPDFYSCPFSMFDSGRPSMEENGAVMYCDMEGSQCPSMYFCSAGYDDDRSVCCHMLGKYVK